MNKLFIPIVLGTVRKQSNTEKVTNWIYKKTEEVEGVKTIILDPRTMKLPMDDENDALVDDNKEFQQAVEKADGLIIVTPEYNHSYPGSLKRMLDLLYDEYRYKPVALIGVSSGHFGGVRAIEHLLPVLKAYGSVTQRHDLYFGNVNDVFDSSGEVKDEAYKKRFDLWIQDLLFLAKSLRWGRENIAPKFYKDSK